jgi:serine/threonine-protein kinase
MPDDPRVAELLVELLDSGGTPEEVCRECPDLLPQVRARWQRVRAVEAGLGRMFPQSTVVDQSGPAPSAPGDLPRVPGYDVQGVLGRGGMGVVYKAWHLRLHRTVALKMLLAGAYAQPQERERFLREAEAVAGLRHANIVQVYDVGDLDGLPYFTMEFVEGGNLTQKLAGTPQPADQAAALVTTLALAIGVAHQSGIVHRDLKPSNILLAVGSGPWAVGREEKDKPAGGGQQTAGSEEKDIRASSLPTAHCPLSALIPKITDFGLARRLEAREGLTVTGLPIGTPSYMAPEQAQGQKEAIAPATDVYALGAILYELLTGRPPFKGETAAETLLQVISHEPASPARLNAKVPRDLETICLKCLEKAPQKRYASAQALADDLKRFQEGRPIRARPLGWWGHLWRWARRNPAAAALVVTALALVGLAAGGGFWLER